MRRDLVYAVLLTAALMTAVTCAPASAPSPTGPSPDPTIRAQATQIASLQQQIASLQAAPAQAKAPPTATSPTAAARLFFEALFRADVRGALDRMSVAAQSTQSSMLPGLASALAPCSRSAMESTSLSNSVVQTLFTPPCSDARTVISIIFPGQEIIGVPPNRPLVGCALTVQIVNDEWKVTGFNICPSR